MEVRITNTDSEHTKKFIGIEGTLMQLEKIGMVIDRGEKYLQTSRIEKIIVKTKHTTYEMEVL